MVLSGRDDVTRSLAPGKKKQSITKDNQAIDHPARWMRNLTVLKVYWGFHPHAIPLCEVVSVSWILSLNPRARKKETKRSVFSINSPAQTIPLVQEPAVPPFPWDCPGFICGWIIIDLSPYF